MLMSIIRSFSLVLSILLQNGYAPDFPAGIFTEKEARKIEKKSNDIEGRIKVYREASERMLKTLRQAVSRKESQAVPGILSIWKTLLTESLKDIENNLERKEKKSKPLIKYEIQIRKALKEVQDFKIRAPVDQQDVFNNTIDLAADVRSKMVEILFNPGQLE